MKKKNCRCEFASQRSELLLQNFRESIASQSVISLHKAFLDAAQAPMPRFWVSEARATRIVSMLLKGKTEVLESMHPQKREMFEEIYRRVVAALNESPERPVGDIVFETVNSEAPCSYITPEWAGKIIYKARKS